MNRTWFRLGAIPWLLEVISSIIVISWFYSLAISYSESIVAVEYFYSLDEFTCLVGLFQVQLVKDKNMNVIQKDTKSIECRKIRSSSF